MMNRHKSVFFFQCNNSMHFKSSAIKNLQFIYWKFTKYYVSKSKEKNLLSTLYLKWVQIIVQALDDSCLEALTVMGSGVSTGRKSMSSVVLPGREREDNRTDGSSYSVAIIWSEFCTSLKMEYSLRRQFLNMVEKLWFYVSSSGSTPNVGTFCSSSARLDGSSFCFAFSFASFIVS